MATTETFNTATFRIDGLGKGGMSTRSYGGCGEEGLFITIPKIYMTGDLKKISDYFGPPGNVDLLFTLAYTEDGKQVSPTYNY